MTKNIFNFMIKYFNYTLRTRKNLHKWLSFDSPSCSFAFNLKHSSILSRVVHPTSMMADLPGITNQFYSFSRNLSPLCNTAHYMLISPFSIPFFDSSFRPDIALITHDKTLKNFELTSVFKTNLKINNGRVNINDEVLTYTRLKSSMLQSFYLLVRRIFINMITHRVSY